MWLASIEAHMPFVLLFLGRTIRISVLTVLFALAFALSKLIRPSAGPRLLRWYLQSGGAGFAKLGQILAMRFDLLPAPYCEELLKLLDRLPPVPADLIAWVIKRDLAAPISDYFAEFETIPLASASVAQVHGAQLLDGKRVVIKVLRPGVRERFRIDLAYLRFLGRCLNSYRAFASLNLGRVFREVTNLTLEELDFRREARNIQQMHDRMVADDIDHYAPRVYPLLCGPSMITMERIDGVSVSEMLTAIETKNATLLNTWAEAGITPERSARILMRSILEQSLRHRLFHADPHAANLILMKGGTVAWVDFGMVGWLDERLWLHQFKIREAISAGKIHAAYQHLLAALEPIPATDLSLFEPEVKEYFRDWLASSESTMATISQKSSGYFFVRLLDAVRRAGLSFPTGLVRLYRAIIIGDIVMLKLDPQIDWLPVLHEFIVDEQFRLTKSLCAETISVSTLNAGLQAYINAPRAALDLFDWIQYRLPAWERTLNQQLSRSERVFLLGFQYSRLAIGLATFGVLVVRFFAPGFLSEMGWLRMGDFVRVYWIVLLVAGGLLLLLLTRVINEFERPDLK
jgi:ubiquinone biosynthesis protein